MNCECNDVHAVKAAHFLERTWDRAGASVSLLCLVHCLILPLAPLFALSIPAWVTDESVHPYLSMLALMAAIPAAWLGYRKHSNACIVGSVLLGSALVILSGFFHEGLGESLSHGAMIIGSAVLVVGHWFNWRLSSRAN